MHRQIDGFFWQFFFLFQWMWSKSNPFWKIYDNNLFSTYFCKKSLYDFLILCLNFNRPSLHTFHISRDNKWTRRWLCYRSCGAVDLFLSRVTKGWPMWLALIWLVIKLQYSDLESISLCFQLSDWKTIRKT